VGGYGDEAIIQEVFVCRFLSIYGSGRPYLCLVSRTSSKGKMKYIRAFFIIAGFLIIAFGATVVHTNAQARTQNVVQIVVVPGGRYDQVVLPPGDIVGFSCAAGITSVQPDCYILVK
jgi:hypothetical protein